VEIPLRGIRGGGSAVGGGERNGWEVERLDY